MTDKDPPHESTLPESAAIILRAGGRERSLPLWKETARDLRAWLAVRGQASVPELFVNAQGGAMTRAGFEYILAKHAATAASMALPPFSRSWTPTWVQPASDRCAPW